MGNTKTKTITKQEVETKTTKPVEKVESKQPAKVNLKEKLSGSQYFWYIFLCIITFSIFYFVIKSKVNKANQKDFSRDAEPTSDTTKQLKRSVKVPFAIEELIEALGGQDNILTVEASLSSTKIGVKEKDKINQEAIKKLGAKGIMISGLKVSMVFGDISIAIKEALDKKLGY